MKTKIFNAVCKTRYLALLVVLIFTCGNVWADYASNFTDKNLSVGTGELTWSASPAFNSYESSGSARGAQSTKATTTITITSANISGTITQIDVVGSMNGGGSMSVTVGGSSFGSSETIAKGDSKKTYTFSGSATVTNKAVVITVTRSASATFWIKSVAITTASGASVATPTFSVTEGTYNSNQSVTISCATAGSTIYYTTDGSTPTSSSTAYSSAVAISSTTTLKAIAIKGGTNSSVASATYTLKCATPTFSPAAGTYGAAQSVSISTTYGTNIYYTTDGTTPSTSSTLYSSAISVSESQTIKAIAVKTGCSNSEVGEAAYTINIPYTVSFSTGTGNPQQADIPETVAGAGITLPDGPTPACSGDGWSFAGWGYESCDETTDEPFLYFAGNTYYPESNETLHAVYVKGKTASANYKLISDAAQIVSGENYVIAAYYNSNDYAITAETQSTYYIKQTAVTVTENVISSPGAKIIWQLTNEGGSNVSLYNSNQSKYLYVYASSSYRNLGLYGSKKQFTMTEEREAGYASTFAFNSTDYTSYYINYDASHTDFGTKTSSDENLYLYKRQYTGTYESNPTCKDVKSISVQTAPTKLTYCAGDMFDPTGLVIRVTYTDDSYENVTYSGHESDFSFTPSTSTALTTGNTSVTITYRSDKSTTQAITVNTAYTITLTGSGSVTGGTISADNSSACAGSTITLTATPNTHYTFSSWNVTSGGSPVTVTSNQFTMPSGNVTVNATFTEDAYRTVVFKSNKQALFDDGGSATTFDGTNKWKQKVYLTEKPVWPTDLVVGQACDADSKAFRGWVADGQTWPGKEASVPVGSTLITDASNFAAAASGSGDVVYHAVWAEASGSGSPHYAKVTSTGDITNGDYLIVYETASVAFDGSLSTVDANSNYIDVTISDSKITANSTINASKFTIDISNKYIKSASNKYINQGTYANGLAGNDAATAVHSMSIDGSGNFVVEGTGASGSAYVSLRYNASSDQKRFRFYKSGQQDIQLYKYDAGATYSNYMTTCCEHIVPAPEVTGTSTKNTITLSWDNVTGATGYTVTCSGGTPGEVTSSGTSRSCEITGLSPNTDYTWTVVATYTSPYCQATAANGSTTTQQVYAVSYNKNGGTIANLPSGGSYAAGETVNVAAKPDGNVSKSGCTFTGWNTQNDGQGTHYDADGTKTFTMPSSAVTLYAEWTKKKNYYVDRMHGTNEGHTVTIGDVVYNCYLREGANYTVPTISDNTSGASACHSEHDHLLFWVTESSVNADGTLKNSYTEVTPGSSKTATNDGTIYYAIWGKLAD